MSSHHLVFYRASAIHGPTIAGGLLPKDKFAKDMNLVLQDIEPTADSDTMEQLSVVRDRLVELNRKRLVKINHSVMQVLCAKHLIEQGYNVKVEHPLVGGQLMADLFAVRQREPELEYDIESILISERLGLPEDKEALVVEVETGFVPPKAALYPVRYRQTRIAAKIARYCRYSHRFGLATPNYHVLQIPRILLRPVEHRDMDVIQQLKDECDLFYKSPPILFDTLAMSEIDSIYIINVDNVDVTQISPEKYLDSILRAEGVIFE